MWLQTYSIQPQPFHTFHIQKQDYSKFIEKEISIIKVILHFPIKDKVPLHLKGNFLIKTNYCSIESSHIL